MPFSDGEANQIINTFTTQAAASYPEPADFYVALSKTTPTNTGTNVNEPTTGNYARLLIAPTDWDAAVVQQAVTNVDKSFNTATADWLAGMNLVSMAFWDHLTDSASTNFLGHAALTTAKPVLNNDTAKILAGNLKIKTT